MSTWKKISSHANPQLWNPLAWLMSFYVLPSDFIGADGKDDIPDSVKLRNCIRTMLESKFMNKSQKLDAISFLIN